jgi:dTDP-4-dehydrorhamnose 3,5-epimerase
MEIIQTGVKDCFILKPRVFSDHRGYFFESYNHKQFVEQTGLDINFVQDNQAKSEYGTLRGLHFQRGEYAQAKLVRVFHGRVLDVAVDMREDSATYMQHVAVELSAIIIYNYLCLEVLRMAILCLKRVQYFAINAIITTTRKPKEVFTLAMKN